MSARRQVFALAALAPAFAGCGLASYALPQGGRPGRDCSCAPCVSEVCLPPHADLSCAAFAIDGAEASPPFPTIEESSVEETAVEGNSGEGNSVLVPLEPPQARPTDETIDETASDLPLLAPANHLHDAGGSIRGEALPLGFTERDLPPPVMTETEEEAQVSREREAALALQAARSVLKTTQRESTDVTVGVLPDPIEHDPAPVAPTPKPFPSIERAPKRLAETVEPARADYVNAPLAKLPRPGLLHGRLHHGAVVRPGIVAGLRGRLSGHGEPPEPVPFVVYERVSPKFFPVPTKPVFEPAFATYITPAFAAGGSSARPKTGGFAPPSLGMPPAVAADGTIEAETLPRPLPSMEALPLPQPGMELPPAPQLGEP